MSFSVNKVILVGTLGKDPEVHSNSDGNKGIIRFPLGTTETWKDKITGERKERTEWHRVVIFNDALADVAQKYLKKDSRVYVEGQLKVRRWTDENGQEKYTAEVLLPKYRGELIILESKKEVDGNFLAPKGNEFNRIEPGDDEIPF